MRAREANLPLNVIEDLLRTLGMQKLSDTERDELLIPQGTNGRYRHPLNGPTNIPHNLHANACLYF